MIILHRKFHPHTPTFYAHMLWQLDMSMCASRMQPVHVETAVWIWAVLPDLSRKQVIGLTEQSHNKHLALQKGISVFAYTSYEFLNIIVLIYSTNCIFLQQNIY